MGRKVGAAKSKGQQAPVEGGTPFGAIKSELLFYVYTGAPL